MAITYKSQGSGVATETSGAALSPACPATVDAGDILIACVYFEDTATTPSTPSGWTLLDGPRVIESTIGRMWVYGKIADGSEDGATAAFGTPAVTTMRAARIHSFAGRVAGTITELVRSFAFLSHATDPQMPSVTTTQAGALAAAHVVQNDNNSLAAATGASGGTWAEAVAEFVSALTPGLVLQMQTATPTADPGTISGGAVAATNDPSGVVAFEIRASAPQDVAAGVGAATLTGFAPTVSASSNMNVLAGVGLALLTAFAPTVTATNHQNVQPGTGQIVATGLTPGFDDIRQLIIDAIVSAQGETNGWNAQRVNIPVTAVVRTSDTVVTITLPAIAGYDISAIETLTLTVPQAAVELGGPLVGAPTMTITVVVEVLPGVGAAALTGFAPTVSAGAAVEVLPGVASAVLAGLAPGVVASDHKNVAAGVGAAILTGLTPTVSATANQNVLAGVGAAVLTGFAPAALAGGNQEVQPGVGAALLSGFAPTVTATAHQNVLPGTGALALTGFPSTVATPVDVLPGVGASVLAGFAPTVTSSASQNAQPGTGLALLTGFAATVTATAHQNVQPGVGALALIGFVPVILAGNEGVPGELPYGLTFVNDDARGLALIDDTASLEFTE